MTRTYQDQARWLSEGAFANGRRIHPPVTPDPRYPDTPAMDRRAIIAASICAAFTLAIAIVVALATGGF